VNINFPWPKTFDVKVHIGGRSSIGMGAILLGQSAILLGGEYTTVLTGILMTVVALFLADVSFPSRLKAGEQ